MPSSLNDKCHKKINKYNKKHKLNKHNKTKEKFK